MKGLLLVATVVGIGSLLTLWWSGAFAAAGVWPFWLAVMSVVSLILPLVLLPVVVVRMPADYFVASRQELRARRTAAAWLWLMLRNVVGALLLAAGVAMLVLPGQGLLTMLVGLLLLDLPGKRRLELALVRRPMILTELNALRAKRGVVPLQTEQP